MKNLLEALLIVLPLFLFAALNLASNPENIALTLLGK